MLCVKGRVFPCKKYLKVLIFKRALHIAENPKTSGNGICRRALGRSIDYSTAIQAERYRGYQTFAEIFCALYYRQGGVYTPSL
jgi:hypothetical protein